MTTLAYYLLKVILCSGILFLYYQAALKNKIFHQWNRFYLLSIVVLSLLLPVLQLSVWQPSQEKDETVSFVLLLQSADEYLENITIRSTPAVSPEKWIALAYSLFCCVLLCSLATSLLKIRTIINTNPVQEIDSIRFVTTREPGSPFSFLRYIFWNADISLQTETGQQIFQHELVHVQQKHTLDKLLLQTLLVFFWCNPFFWLIRRELTFVHEFIADKKAAQQHGTEAFAAMILIAAYPQHYHSITNQFFQTSIKRRLLMLTKVKNPNVAYVSRILALPLIATTVFAFTVRTKALPEAVKPESAKTVMADFGTVQLTDTVPQKQIRSVNVKKGNGNQPGTITLVYSDGTSETMTETEAKQRGLLNKTANERIAIGRTADKYGKTKTIVPDPLFLLDGKEITRDEMYKLIPTGIQSINVLKGQLATDKYGDKGKNGVVEITWKTTNSNSGLSVTENGKPAEQNEVVAMGHPLQKAAASTSVDDNKIFSQTETPATIDQQEWRAFLAANLQPIIENAARKGAKPGTYTVNIRFLVKKDGNLSDFMALNNPGFDFDKQILAVMPNSPKWKPAVQNGQLVNSYHTQPITFVIQAQ